MAQIDPKHLRLVLDKAKLSAQLVIEREAADAYEPAALEDLLAFVRDQGLEAPNEDAVRSWAEAAEFAEPVEVAAGTPPVPGTDGYVEYLFNEESGSNGEAMGDATAEATGDATAEATGDAAAEATGDATAEATGDATADDGQVDYREWNTLHTVDEGQLLARVIPPVPGTPGRDVFGEEVAAPVGRTVKLEVGRNVVLEQDDSLARSGIAGLVHFQGRKLEVSPVYHVAGDVDMSVGNIHFNGDVVVDGNVLEGFVVEADGDIEVRKNVDKGSVTAGGDVRVHGTIYGKDEVWVNAAGNVRARNAENANIEAKEDAIIDHDTITSHVIARHAYLGSDSAGHLRGSVVETTGDVAVGILGSPGTSTVTHIEIKWEKGLIRLMKEFKDQREAVARKRDEVERKLLHLRRMEEQGRTLSPNQQKQLEAFEAEAHQCRESETELHFRREDIGERIEQSRKSTIELRGKVFPDATLIIHGKTLTIQEEREAMRVEADPDRLRTVSIQ